LTHGSHQQDFKTVSYERMEFLGDSVLDMIVTDYLYHAPGKKYSPGHMHLRKSAVVNMHFLAYICLRCSLKLKSIMAGPNEKGKIQTREETTEVHLWQCLLHSSHRVLDDQNMTFARYQKNRASIDAALDKGSIFPWGQLSRLQSPKFFSDMIESVIGAVYLDSRGDWDMVRGVLQSLGILPVLERIVRDEVDVLHPVSRLAVWASQQAEQKKVKYTFEKEKGKIICIINVDEEEVYREEEIHRGHASQDQVRFVAAENYALKIGVSVSSTTTKSWKRKKQSDA